MVSNRFAGPTTAPVSQARAALDDSEDSKRLVLDWFEALSTGRLEEAYKLMDPDGGYWVLRQRTTLSNARFAEIFTDAWNNTFIDGITFTVGALTADANRVAAVVEGHATLASSGEPYDNMYHYLFTVDGPLIRHVCEFADTYRSAQAFAPPGGAP
jgi:ketosteroid isomerase-like protein